MHTPLKRPWRELGLPALLLAASTVTTTAIGARFMQNFLDGLPTVAAESDLWPWPWLLHDPSRFLLGWPFSLALLGILLTHEFGHYFACRAHGIPASLPFVLPAPTLSGTLGAVIRIRGSISSRRALMDIGAFGPIAGYAASLVVIAIGFLLSRPIHAGLALPNLALSGLAPSAQLIDFGQPLTLGLIHRALLPLHPGIPAFALGLRHPVLIAGWVGLFVTSLNLIPGGQLDGGHILYALSPRIHHSLRWLLPATLVLLGLFYWLGWLLWGLVLLIPAMRHPTVAAEAPLPPSRKLIAAITLLLFVLTFSLQPFAGSSILQYFR